MLTRVELNYFKNYGSRVVVDVYHPSDAYPFSVIVGRNGSGKSALIDAIEWCLFQRKAKDLRAANVQALTNSNSPNGKMHVVVSFFDAQSLDMINIKREYDGTRAVTTLHIIHPSEQGKETFLRLQSHDELRLMLERYRIAVGNIDRILIEQNTSTIVCESPTNLLEFLERSIGTDVIRVQIEKSNIDFSLFNQIIQETEKSLRLSLLQKGRLTPKIISFVRLLEDKHALNRKWMDFYNIRKRELNEQSNQSTVELATVGERRDGLGRDLAELQAKQVLAIAAGKSARQHLVEVTSHLAIAVKIRDQSHAKLSVIQKSVWHAERENQNTARQCKAYKEAVLRCKKIRKENLKTQASENSAMVELKAQHTEATENLRRAITACQVKATKLHTEDETRGLLHSFLHSVAQLSELNALSQKLHESVLSEEKVVSDRNQQNRAISSQIKLEEDAISLASQQLNDCFTKRQEHLNAAGCLEDKIRKSQGRQQQLRQEIQLCTSMSELSTSGDAALKKFYRLSELVKKVKSKESLVCGMLASMLTISEDRFYSPVLSVLGEQLLKTVVVMNRIPAAVSVAEACRAHDISHVSIDILGEAPVHAINNCHSWKCPSNFVYLLDCLCISSPDIHRLISGRVSTWLIYIGVDSEDCLHSALESLNRRDKSSIQQRRLNVVTLSGRKFFRDGEIRTREGPQFNPYLFRSVLGPQDVTHASFSNTDRMCSARSPSTLTLALNYEMKCCDEALTLLNEVRQLVVNEEVRSNDHRCLIDEHQSNLAKFRRLLQLKPLKNVPRKSQAEYLSTLMDRKTELELAISRLSWLDCAIEPYKRSEKIHLDLQKLMLNAVEIEADLCGVQTNMERAQEDLKSSLAKVIIATSNFEATALAFKSHQNSHFMFLEDHAAHSLRTQDAADIVRSLANSLAQIGTMMKRVRNREAIVAAKITTLKSKIADITIEVHRTEQLSSQNAVQSEEDQIVLDQAGRFLSQIQLLSDECKRDEIDITEVSHPRKKSKQRHLGSNAVCLNQGGEVEESLLAETRDMDDKILRSGHSGLLSEWSALIAGEDKDQNELARAKAEAKTLYGSIIQLQEERYTKLFEGLKTINQHLQSTFSAIVPSGECYISHASDPVSIFAEGLSVCARYGSSSKYWEVVERCIWGCLTLFSLWKQVRQMSGGQQAVCGLSLLLAIQLSYPSPLYIMDEIDAALDITTARRVGHLIRQRCRDTSSQFLLISHRPEMQEAASRIIGIYRRYNLPVSVSVAFA